MQDKQKRLLSEILEKLNDLFEGDLTESDQLSFVNTLKSKLGESEVLVQQARNNEKPQFGASPDLQSELQNAIIDAFAAHQTMSKQALDSEKVRAGLISILLGPAGLYEWLREQPGNRG